MNMLNNKDRYKSLLKDPRWISRRNEILTRDKNTCQLCGCNDKYLHVHHRYYTEGLLPWEYGDECLVTLCEDCHAFVHYADNNPSDITVGQVCVRYHSDFENTAIVYHVDLQNGLVFTLECDNGTSYDNIYDECNTFASFAKKYDKIDCEREQTIYLFETWFLYVSDHLELTPFPFRYNYQSIISKTPYLQEILSNRELYDYRR